MAQGRVGSETEVVREKPPAARAITTHDNLSEARRADMAEPLQCVEHPHSFACLVFPWLLV